MERERTMFRQRRIEKKLDLLLKRQCVLAEVLFSVELKPQLRKKIGEKFNDLWDEIMEGENGKRG